MPSLGALVSDRAGVINIGLEGMMLAAAFTGVVISAYSQTWFGPETGKLIGPWLGLLLGVLVLVFAHWARRWFPEQILLELRAAGTRLQRTTAFGLFFH